MGAAREAGALRSIPSDPRVREIVRAEELQPDERWLAQRDVFEILYSYPRAVPFLHRSCAERTRPPQYLRRHDEAGVICPTCGARVAPELVRALRMLGEGE